MLHTLGTDGTITATTLENRLRTLILHIQTIEKETGTLNINKADVIIDSVENSETELMRGNAQIYCNKVDFLTLAVINPYVGVSYNKGTGTSNATNYMSALLETAFLLYKAEGSSINNPNKIDRKLTDLGLEMLDEPLSLPVLHNALFTFNFEIPLITVVNGDSSTTQAREWLTGTMQ